MQLPYFQTFVKAYDDAAFEIYGERELTFSTAESDNFLFSPLNKSLAFGHKNRFNFTFSIPGETDIYRSLGRLNAFLRIAIATVLLTCFLLLNDVML